MASIFNKTNNLYENPKRNTFDHSFQNNLTLNFGELVPFMCKECLPGDSFKIDPTISLKMVPFLFPVQTRVRAHMHFFYVTNRSLWKDWMDFIGNTKQNLELPYISYNKKKIYTGSLYDYMGLPTTSIGQEFIKVRDRVNIPLIKTSDKRTLSSETLRADLNVAKFVVDSNNTQSLLPLIAPVPGGDLSFTIESNNTTPTTNDIENFTRLISYFTNDSTSLRRDSESNTDNRGTIYPDRTSALSENKSIVQPYSVDFVIGKTTTNNNNLRCYIIVPSVNTTPSYFIDNDDFLPIMSTDDSELPSNAQLYVHFVVDDKDVYYLVPSAYLTSAVSEYNDRISYIGLSPSAISLSTRNESETLDILINEGRVKIQECAFFFDLPFTNGTNDDYHISLPFADGNSIKTTFSIDITQRVYNTMPEPIDISSDIVDNNVYSQLKISALPFRAYEAIYNSFYRDERNNPLIENGEPVYNKYILNTEGGEDSTEFSIYKRNWESDFLTTAVQSPQQGIAPLVGITANGEISFKDSDTGELYTAHLNATDGDTIDSFVVTSPNMPSGNLRQLVDFATAGISISDLRGVNALQRWLEINMRRGLRYKDQIMSHFGVDVRYDELMMPEFIGGFSEDIYINQVNQTIQTEEAPLGSFAGQGGAFGSSKHSINHFCQEHGFIIGIMSIVPVANYSQLLPKHFLKRELLDYFYPEFGHLGMQPITYSEVCPIEAVNNNVPLSDVFGYQRAWYDYLASTDEVHGLFRTSLRNFVIGRKFAGAPELSPEFLTVSHNEIDDVFAVQSSEYSHKFFGQIYLDCKVKRPIPEYGIPKLEV